MGRSPFCYIIVVALSFQICLPNPVTNHNHTDHTNPTNHTNHSHIVWSDPEQHQLLSGSRHYKGVLDFEMLTPVKNLHGIVKASEAYGVRLMGGRNSGEGRVEIEVGGEWGTVCPDRWTVLEAMVVCKQLGLKYASNAVKSRAFGGIMSRRLASGVECYGDEDNLSDCHHHSLGPMTVCKHNFKAAAGVMCVDKLPDLIPNATMIQNSIYLQDLTMARLTCAMEENCAAPEAFALKAKHNNWHQFSRRLLRFSAMTWNFGTAEFRPYSRRNTWEWHQCHLHYHSMANFAEYDVVDKLGNRVAHGHKASFCLEDNYCTEGVPKKYVCEGYGEQGMSIGCADIYLHEIDCQWIDITEIPVGNYTFKMNVNPEYRVAELDFNNNAVLCDLVYTGSKATASNCKLTRG